MPSLVLGPLAHHKLGFDRQLVPGQAEGLAGEVLGHAGQLKHHLARLDNRDPALRGALAGAHPRLSGLLGVGLVREDVDPDLAATFDLAGRRHTGGLDLAVGDPTAAERAQPVLTEGNVAAALGVAAHPAAHLFAVLDPLRHQHEWWLLPAQCASAERKPNWARTQGAAFAGCKGN